MPSEEVSLRDRRPFEIAPRNPSNLPQSITQRPSHQVSPNTMAQPPLTPYHPSQAPLYYYGAYPCPPYTLTSPSYTYVTPPRYLTTGGNTETYAPSIPGICPIQGTSPFTHPPIPQVQYRPVVPAVLANSQVARPTHGNQQPGGISTIPPRNLNHDFVAVRNLNDEENNIHYSQDPPDQNAVPGRSRHARSASKRDQDYPPGDEHSRRPLQEGQGESRDQILKGRRRQTSRAKRDASHRGEQGSVFYRERERATHQASRSSRDRERRCDRGRDRTRRGEQGRHHGPPPKLDKGYRHGSGRRINSSQADS